VPWVENYAVHSGIVTGKSGIVTDRSGNMTAESGKHLRSVTFGRIRRSRSTGLTGHVRRIQRSRCAGIPRLDQGDFYQLHAYGQNYLDGDGDVVLIYPKTDAFSKALPVFEFPKSSGLRLWVLPFCLKQKRLQLPSCGSLNVFFVDAETADSVVREVRIPASVDRFQTVTSSS